MDIQRHGDFKYDLDKFSEAELYGMHDRLLDRVVEDIGFMALLESRIMQREQPTLELGEM